MEEVLEHKVGYKKTKLGWIPEEWEVKKLEDFGFFLKGKGISKKDLVEEGTPCVRYGELYSHHNDYIKEFYSFIPPSIIEKCEEIFFGDILFTGSGETLEEIGKCVAHILDITSYAGGDIIIFRNHKQIPLYLGYQLNSNSSRRQISKLGQGNSVVHIYSSSLKNIKIPLPPLPEQKKIAQILSTWDEAIQHTQALITQLEQRKKGLMQQLLTGKTRLPGFDGEWETYFFDELIKNVSRPVEWDDGALYDLISVRRRSGGLFQRESLLGKDIKTKKLKTARTGDFLISKMQIVHGASGLVSERFDNMKISGSYLSLTPKDKTVLNIDFFNWISKLPYFYHQTFIASYGVHIEKMTFDFKSFLKLKTSIPPLKEQTAIANVLTAADKEINHYKTYLNQLQHQKKGLMQQLLTGKTRVKTS